MLTIDPIDYKYITVMEACYLLSNNDNMYLDADRQQLVIE